MAAQPESGYASRADIRVIMNDISYMRDDVKEIKETLKNNYVTVERFNGLQARFALLEKVVYGVIGLALVLLFTSLFSGVIK